MARPSKKEKKKQKASGTQTRNHESTAALDAAPGRWFQRSRLWMGLVLLILLAFGTYKAWTLYGAYPVPNPDFPGFISIGKTLLHFEIPTDFKRAPMVGVFQVLLSKLLNTDSPELSAGWLLNAILSVVNIVLLWQIARQFIGKAGAFLAIVAMLNPWVLRSQVNPIAETTMIFFILASFYCMFRRSRWVYLFVSIAALVRYECAALIFLAFLMDMILQKGMRQRLIAFGYSAIASIPFMLWMLGTYVKWGHGTGGNKSHYLRHYGHGMVGWGFIKMVWDSAFGVLTVWPKFLSSVFEADTLTLLNQTLAVLLILVALGYAVYKKQWKMLPLVIFLVLYLLVHATRANSHHRYTVPVAWIPQLMAAFGVYALWKIAAAIPKIPAAVKWVLLGAICIAAVVWIVQLYPGLAQVAPYYKKGQWLAHSGMLAGVLVFVVSGAALWMQSRFQRLLPLLTVALVSCVFITSEHFTAASIIDNGSYYIEFKLLSDWYKEHSQPGEKIASRWAGTLRLINAKRSDDFVHTNRVLGAETMEEFIQKCYDHGVVFVTACPRGSSGTKKNVKNILPILNKGQSYGPLQYLGTIKVSQHYWIHIYRLHPPRSATSDNPG